MEDKYLNIPIFDSAVKNEIESILDENNILLYSQLNPKIFRLPIDDFFELAILFASEENPDKSREAIEERVLSQVKKLAAENEEVRTKISANEEGIADLPKSTLKYALVKGSISFGVDLLAH